MTYKKRIASLVLVDSLIVILSIFISFYMLLPFGELYDGQISTVLIPSSIVLLLSHHFFAYRYKLYKRVWQYSSVSELLGIIKAVSFSIIIVAVLQLALTGSLYTRTLVITWMMHILLIGGSRFAWRMYRDTYIKPDPDRKRALIIGAGAAGTTVARELKQKLNSELYPIGFIDDDFTKHHLEIMNIPVLGGVDQIEEIVKENRVEHIIIAIPSLSRNEIQRIYAECAKTSAETKILPLLEDIMTGKVEVNEIREVQVEDLLGREPVELDLEIISNNLEDKTILVTGAGGSIGSEICRQVSRFKPKKLILLGHGENSIYMIDMELRKKFGEIIEIIPIIADVQHRERIFEVVEEYKPSVIYHAAAHKHVPLMEYNPSEAVKNNIYGTKNIAEAAHEFGVENFVMVSTDKAVNPPNVMGATKRFAEMIVQNLAKESNTKFAAVRFGNVLGSRGSVIPLFKKQIEAGGPVTITDPEMTRYFMTIPEASRLVIQAGTLAEGGEVFVLDMGEPVKIVDLAKNLIRLSGYTEAEIKIKYSGIRPGEKLFEELLNEDEIQSEKVFPKIYVGKAMPLSKYELDFIISDLAGMCREEMVRTLISVANRKVVGDLIIGQRSS
ncbi:nucleoside-diphosphate sugar epimerase/dehydratase [Jeotgalibacillus sp. ET6]|uniref:nucleoside-diphosphate sugar epimerase/dehydratase n=1 Tax=Jeotgalibacillus sp. ET6 TaxID=3037260 RepID=UPI00241878AE|nr:nucleoside-diphosphate sugar epimerase/dehydratase [Jeotgalibacillus sp. ET6]MDG5471359.1 nucleoside-diphosphate sugar epimerase/dehydratase [Jeotgalibacillus sp. ET6]